MRLLALCDSEIQCFCSDWRSVAVKCTVLTLRRILMLVAVVDDIEVVCTVVRRSKADITAVCDCTREMNNLRHVFVIYNTHSLINSPACGHIITVVGLVSPGFASIIASGSTLTGMHVSAPMMSITIIRIFCSSVMCII